MHTLCWLHALVRAVWIRLLRLRVGLAAQVAAHRKVFHREVSAIFPGEGEKQVQQCRSACEVLAHWPQRRGNGRQLDLPQESREHSQYVPCDHGRDAVLWLWRANASMVRRRTLRKRSA